MDINLETVLLVLLIILPVAYFLWRNRRLEPQVQQSLDERREEYVHKMTAQYGEPEQSLWTAEMPLLCHTTALRMSHGTIHPIIPQEAESIR